MTFNLHQPPSDWKSRLADGFDTKNARLRRYKDSDRPHVMAILAQNNSYDFIEDLSDHIEGIAWFDHVSHKRNHLFLTLMPKTHDRVMGLFMFHSQPDGTLRLGAMIDEAFWNKGHTTDFLWGLHGHIKSQAFPHPITADVHENHTHARHILEKTGWLFTGSVLSENRLLYRLAI